MPRRRLTRRQVVRPSQRRPKSRRGDPHPTSTRIRAVNCADAYPLAESAPASCAVGSSRLRTAWLARSGARAGGGWMQAEGGIGDCPAGTTEPIGRRVGGTVCVGRHPVRAVRTPSSPGRERGVLTFRARSVTARRSPAPPAVRVLEGDESPNREDQPPPGCETHQLCVPQIFRFGHVRQLDAVAARVTANLAGCSPPLPGADKVAYIDVDDICAGERRILGGVRPGWWLTRCRPPSGAAAAGR
jgi:hypothetical protein